MINRIKANCAVLIKYGLAYWSSLSALACVWLSFISWEDMGINRKLHRVMLLLGIVAFSFILSVFTIFLRKRKKIFGDINKGVTLCYGDIIKLGFPKRLSKKRIVVIPVNRCFDLSYEGNLISEKTIHGQWIKRYITSEQKRENIHKEILNKLAQQNAAYIELKKEDKRAGYLKRYDPGTIVELKGLNNINFYLLAVSEFDSNLRANCSESDFYTAIQGLMEYYDINGQGYELYCPIMGDHIMRPTRETNDIISLMLSILKFNRLKIHGKIHIVVYDQMKGNISILEQ